MSSNIKRAGIITWHYVHNYGAMLQTVALQTAINNMRKDVIAEIIDYPKTGERRSNIAAHLLYKPASRTQNHYIAARDIYIEEVNKRHELFESFMQKFMNLSMCFADIDALTSNCVYDIYISGGDQIWETDRFNYKTLFPFMLGFTKSPNKFAYGCGMAARHTEPYEIDSQYLSLLREYKRIMVREDVGALTLRCNLNRDVDLVLDPALLLEAEDYLPFVQKQTDNIDEPYIFAYIVGAENGNMDGRLTHLLTEYAKKQKRKMLLAYNGIPINNEQITTMTAIGPSQWLWLIANAESVLANTFHATVFSVIYNRPFVIVQKDTRKTTLLNLLGLSGCLIDRFHDLPQTQIEQDIDFTNANAVLDKERIRCKKLLNEAIDMCK